MKSDTQTAHERPEDIPARIREIDARISGLDERIEKNKSDLERNNTSLTVKIAELCKATVLKRRGSKR